MVDILHSALITGFVGGRYSRTPGGTTLFTSGGGSDLPPAPFSINLTNDGTDDQITLTPGTVNGFLPSNILTPLTVDLKSTVYVSLDVTAPGGGVVGVVVSASGNAFSGQVPTAGTPSSSFSIPAGVILEGIPYNLLAKNWVSAVPVVAFITYCGPSNTPTPYYIWSW